MCPTRPNAYSPLTNALEGTAIGASTLCLAHCLALPLLLLILPGSLAVFAQSEGVHAWILALVAPFALGAFLLGYRRHGRALPALLGVIGITCLAIALFPTFRGEPSQAITVAGSLVLVTGHILNWRDRSHAH